VDAHVKSAERVVRILEAIGRHPPGLSFTDLQALTDVPKSSLHALLKTLTQNGVVELDSRTRRYGPGPKLWELAMGYLRHLEVVPVAWPFLEELRDRVDETVQMAVLDGADVVYVAKAQSGHALQLASHVGSRLPAYATGLGKALLAGLDPTYVRKLYHTEDLPAFTAHTLPTVHHLLRELDETRRRGYARDVGEYSEDVRCLAAPVVGVEGRPVAAVSLSMARDRFSAKREAAMATVLIDVVRAISRRLGGVEWDRWRDPASALQGAWGPAHRGS
jgi:DNA-binding IclR family transcriptional regulator